MVPTLILLGACVECYADTGPWRLIALDREPMPVTTTLRSLRAGQRPLPCNAFAAQQTAPTWFILSHFQGRCRNLRRDRAEIRDGTMILSTQDGRELISGQI